MSLWSYFWAALCLLVWILWQQGAMTVSPAVLGLGFFYALIPTVLGYILYYLGLQQIEDLSKVPVLASLETAAAVVLGMALTGDVLHLPNFSASPSLLDPSGSSENADTNHNTFRHKSRLIVENT